MLQIISILLLLTGCSTWPTGPYKVDNKQDGRCYGSYGGQWGYCDQLYDEEGKPR